MADRLGGLIPDQGDLRPSPRQAADALRVIAAHARSAEDLRELLATVGLLAVKVCTGCREVKQVEEFHRSTAGRKARCRDCTLDAARQRAA